GPLDDLARTRPLVPEASQYIPNNNVSLPGQPTIVHPEPSKVDACSIIARDSSQAEDSHSAAASTELRRSGQSCKPEVI
ncbi:hypothetical protein E2320_013657, partial [Naja naja]